MKTLITIFCLLVLPLSSAAQTVPKLINYQGKLTEEGGLPLKDGSYRLAFRLWDKNVSRETSTLIWGREYDVNLMGGVFNVILGAQGGTEIPGALTTDLAAAFDSPERFLGLTIVKVPDAPVIPEASRREIAPRQQLLSTPFSFQSQRAASLIKELTDALCPPGSIMAFGGQKIPDGWLLCDGRAASSKQFPALFSAIGTAWGAGSAGTTNDFHLPDLRGLFLRGVNGSQTNTNYYDPDVLTRTNLVAGGNFGNAVGSYQGDEIKKHNHTVPSGGGVRHFLSFGGGAEMFYNPQITGDTGGAESRPRNAYVNYIIKY